MLQGRIYDKCFIILRDICILGNFLVSTNLVKALFQTLELKIVIL